MFYFGVDYYPEHWPEERWPVDAQLMVEAGFNVVRLAEFAWAKMEPREGRFDFSWLDRAIAIFHSKGIAVVLGTPTASMPAWLAQKDPSVLRTRENGTRVEYGARRMNCPSHPLYRQHSRSITQAMAEHYASHPALIGWQTDNEFGDRCYCPVCREAFQTWLTERYGTLDELNQRWGTVFWSHTYSNWEQIPLPHGNLGAPVNPSLALDFRRFVSHTYACFQQEQIDILRAQCPAHFITHNMMGFGYPGLNYFDLAKPLDFVSWDDYPLGFWHAQRHTPAMPALSHATMRGLKNKNFWVMEQQAGPSGWENVSVSPRPGELRLWAYQSIAHGADGVVFFRWRTARFGAEQYWHGLLEHDGRAGRRYTEIKQMGAELQGIVEKITGAQTRSKVAILQDYDSRFAFQVQSNSASFGYEKHIAQIYAALWQQGTGVDVISALADLSPYTLVIAPALHVLTEEIAANLRAFVNGGGTLVVTPRTGVKDAANVVVNQPLPGLLAELCGMIVEEYDAIGTEIEQTIIFTPPAPANAAATTLPVQTWCDILQPQGADVLARYGLDYYAGKPAITRNRFGQGQAIYLGAFGTDAFYQTILGWLIDEHQLRAVITVPEDVELTERWQAGARLVFLLNHSRQPHTITLDQPYLNLLNGQPCGDQVTLPALDVLVLEAVGG